MKKKDKAGKFEVVIPQGAHDGDKPKRMKIEKRTGCTKCGKCCREGSPTLLKGDLPLFTSGVLSHDNTYTIREGERVMSYGDDDVYESFMELIKIKNKEDKTECFFYRAEDEKCSIYENRPVQCRNYECWSAVPQKLSPGKPSEKPSHDVFEGLEKNRLTRQEVFHSVDVVLDIIKTHEEKCSYRKLADAFERLANSDESAVEEIMDMLQYDTYARPFLKEKFNIPEGAMDLIMGSPMLDTISGFGFRVKKEGDEYVLLPLENGEEK